MSFLPSLPSFASLAGSPYLHPSQPHPDPPKLHISVTPLQPSTFAGDVFQAQISFRIDKPTPPSSSSPPKAPHPSTTVPTSHAVPPSTPERNPRAPVQPTPERNFKPSHRVVQSLSVRGFEGGGRPVPQTAGPVMDAARRYSEVEGGPSSLGSQTSPLGHSSMMHLEKPGSEDIPPRRGQIGKQPRPKLAVVKQTGPADSHSRQRSISGSELPSLREGIDSEQNEELDVLEGKGKGRATRPEPVRSHSISGIPSSVDTYSPLRPGPLTNGNGTSYITDSPTRTPTRAPPSALSSLPPRDTPPSIPSSHPHARKPSYMPPSTFASTSASPSIGASPRFDSSPRLSGSASTRSGSISPSLPPSGLNPIFESPSSHLPPSSSQENGRARSHAEDLYSQEIEFPASEEPETSETPLVSSFSSRPPPRTANSIGLGRPPSSSQPTTAQPPPSSDPSGSQGLTITWSYVHLVSNLIPSPQYLPPESLLPLRHTLLQSSVVGTGSFPTPPAPHSQGWFSLPPPPRHARAPSLTSSLVGLARGVVWGRGESSLEGERRRKWEESVKEVPVMETLKSVMGVGVELGGKDGVETLDFVYTLDLPANLPPTFQGKALKISYTLVIGVEVEYPLAPFREGIDDPWAPRKRERKSKVLKIPVRVWGGVEGSTAKKGYDLMHPIIHRKEEALLEELAPELAKKLEELQGLEKEGEHDRTPLPSTSTSFDSYALHLLSTLPPPVTPTFPPLPESASPPTTPTDTTPKKTHKHTRSQALSPLSHSVLLPEVIVQGADSAAGGPKSGRRFSLAARLVSGSRSPALGGGGWGGGGFGLEEDGEGSDEILEGLLRGSQKASYDIEKDSQTVAVLTLPKTAYRLGETILGNLSFNSASSKRRVLKVSALLQTHEIIPASLSLPTAPLTLKPIKRTHADHHASLTVHTERMPFSLDIPAAAQTPVSFVLRAGEEGKSGGVEWKVRLAFLVSVPPRKSVAFASGREGSGSQEQEDEPTHLVPGGKIDGLDPRHVGYVPSGGIAPVLREEMGGARGLGVREKGQVELGGWKEMKTEVVECDVPIMVYPPSRLGVAVEDLGGVAEGELIM